MKKINFFIISLILGSHLSVPVFATNKNAGTSGAQFLKMGAGARSVAMGDSVVGLADDVNAAYYNPAGLARLNSPELTALRTQWIQGINYDYGAFVYPTSVGSFAVQAATLKVEDQERRNTEEAALGSFDTLDAAYGISYSKTVYDNFSFGLTGRMIRQQIDNTSANTLSSDLGFLHGLPQSQILWGIAVRNLGQAVKFSEESDPLPLIYDLGASDSFFEDKLKLALDIRFPRDNNVQFGVGSEYRIDLRKEFRGLFRLGYSSANTDADGAKGFAFGAGLGFKKLTFDFSWVPFGDLGNTFRYTATIKF